MAMDQTRDNLLKALRLLRDEGPMDDLSGICHNARLAARRRFNWPWCGAGDWALQSRLEDTFEGMGLDTTYPVPGGRKVYTEYADDFRCMWGRDDEYGAARWRLLDEIISYLENQR